MWAVWWRYARENRAGEIGVARQQQAGQAWVDTRTWRPIWPKGLQVGRRTKSNSSAGNSSRRRSYPGARSSRNRMMYSALTMSSLYPHDGWCDGDEAMRSWQQRWTWTGELRKCIDVRHTDDICLTPLRQLRQPWSKSRGNHPDKSSRVAAKSNSGTPSDLSPTCRIKSSGTPRQLT